MVDISERVEKAKAMVDRGFYFTINRPRQYGKTTLLSALTRRLSNEYICARISFEGIGDNAFQYETAFGGLFLHMFVTSGLAEQFEHGNPKIIAGMSGVELAIEAIEDSA
jgi:hypothetical protein